MSRDETTSPESRYYRTSPDPKSVEYLEDLSDLTVGTKINVGPRSVERTINEKIFSFYSPNISQLLKGKLAALWWISPTIFDSIVDYTLSYEIELSVENVTDVYVFAKTLEIKALVQYCLHYINNVDHNMREQLQRLVGKKMMEIDGDLPQPKRPSSDEEDCQELDELYEDYSSSLQKCSDGSFTWWKKNDHADIPKEMEIDNVINIDGALKQEFDTYDMKSKEPGYFVVFGYEIFYDFDESTSMWRESKRRRGNNEDVKKLFATAKQSGFSCFKYFKNCFKTTTTQHIQRLAKADHSKYSSFVCVILTHGGKDATGEYLLTSDRKKLHLIDFVEPFTAQKCISLFKKPKLFCIQACRGIIRDPGVSVQHGVRRSEKRHAQSFVETELPSEPDFLFAFSVVKDHSSSRSIKEGSHFVRFLCESFQGVSDSEFLEVMTMVNKKFGKKTSWYRDGAIKKPRKQISSITSQLRAEVIFYPIVLQQETTRKIQSPGSDAKDEEDTAQHQNDSEESSTTGDTSDESDADAFNEQERDPDPDDSAFLSLLQSQSPSTSHDDVPDSLSSSSMKVVIVDCQTVTEKGDMRIADRKYDIETLHKTAKEVLGLKPNLVEAKPTKNEVYDQLRKIAIEVQVTAKCLMIIILSTGGKDGIVRLQNNEEMEFEDFTKPFQTCSALFGKPKLFFIQACEYRSCDKLVNEEEDADDMNDDKSKWLPTHADFLIASSTAPEIYTNEQHDSKGTTFIQSLCDVFREFSGKRREILKILTEVNKRVVAEKLKDDRLNENGSPLLHSPKFTTQLRGELYISRNMIEYKL